MAWTTIKNSGICLFKDVIARVHVLSHIPIFCNEITFWHFHINSPKSIAIEIILWKYNEKGMVIITCKSLILGHYFRPASLILVNHAAFSCVPIKSQSIAWLTWNVHDKLEKNKGDAVGNITSSRAGTSPSGSVLMKCHRVVGVWEKAQQNHSPGEGQRGCFVCCPWDSSLTSCCSVHSWAATALHTYYQ